VKWRALRLDTGNYSWGSEAVTRKTRILDVVYNASNNELVRTQTLVKSAIVQVDAAPFKQWYLQHYGVDIGRKKKTAPAAKKEGEVGSLPLILFYSILLCWFFVLRAMLHVLLLLWAWVVNFSSVDFKTWNTVLIPLIVIFTP
jgi:ribosomal protein S8E